MSNEIHLIELLPAHALGSLDEEETVQVAEHVAGCLVCRAELVSHQVITDQLALAAPDAEPPARLKPSILARIQTAQVEPDAEPRWWWQRVLGLFQQATPAWGVAALVLVALLFFSNLWWWQRMNREEPMITSGGMQVVAMAGSDVAPDATATLVISEDGEHGTLVVDGLSPLDVDHQYQLWLIRDGLRTSGGVFSVDAEGYGALWISSPEPLSSYPAFGVTIEPAGGSPGPTGDRVLGGSL